MVAETAAKAVVVEGKGMLDSEQLALFLTPSQLTDVRQREDQRRHDP